MSSPEFKILKKSRRSRARLGVIKTKNGPLHTPAFFPVATLAAVKTLDSQDIKNIGFEGILANTYHLMLRPGSETIKKMGGLHKFMDFSAVIATDSGGFQVFSLGAGIQHKVGKIGKIARADLAIKLQGLPLQSLVKIKDEGAYFKSHLDGKKHFLSPGTSMQIQKDLGADIIFVVDQPSSPLDNYAKTKQAMARTHRWAMRCLEAFQSSVSIRADRHELKQGQMGQMLFGIIQGGKYKTLRQESAKFIGSLDFDGFGIGGSFGKSYSDSKKNMLKALNWTIPFLPENKPRHMLGIGHLDDMENCIKAGIDLFDCVWPTRLARHGSAIVGKNKILNLNQAKFLADKKPLLANCQCPACQNYSRAYICHLIRANEITGLRLLTLHNLYFVKKFIDGIVKKIKTDKI